MNKTIFLLSALVLAVVALSAACGPGVKGAVPTPGTAARGDPAKGQKLFTGTCASCHGPNAKGLPNLGKDLTASTFAKGLSDDDLVKFVTKGRPSGDPANTTGIDMPPRGGNPALKVQDLYDIVAYVRTLQK